MFDFRVLFFEDTKILQRENRDLSIGEILYEILREKNFSSPSHNSSDIKFLKELDDREVYMALEKTKQRLNDEQ
jgi:hypothetical protein